MNVLLFMPDHGACGLYRLWQPATWLARAGHHVRVFNDWHWSHIGEESMDLIRGADAVMSARLLSVEGFEVIRDLNPRAAIMMDMDDDLFHLPPENIANQAFTVERLERLKINLAEADLVTCSTWRLEESLKGLCRDTVVIENAIDPSLFEHARVHDTRVRIGWAGSVTHVVDVMPAMEGLRLALEELGYDRALPVLFGFLSGRLTDMFREVITQPPVPMKNYYGYLLNCGMDIGLAPIRPNRFNEGKSAVKWYEYSFARAATIASRVGPYADEIEDNESGILVDHNSEFQWRDAIIDLARDRDKRDRLAARSKDWIIDNRSPEKIAARLGKALEAKVAKAPARARKSAGSPKVYPSLTIAILSWVPESHEYVEGPLTGGLVEAENKRLADFMMCFSRILGRIRWPNVKVVVLDQGSCAEATLWTMREAEAFKITHGLEVIVETSYWNRGVGAINGVFERHPADYFLKCDNDVMPPVGFDKIMMDVYRRLEMSGAPIGMLGLDPRWGLETFGTREMGKVVARTEKISGHEVNWLKGNSTCVGMCRLKNAERFKAWGGHPVEIMYGTDQVVADRSVAAGFENAHLLPWLAAGPGMRRVPTPLIHIGSTTEERKAFKREQLHKMHEMRQKRAVG